MDWIKNLKIVELAGVLAGPSVGMFFAELGANVTKIEPKGHGDVTRHWRVPGETAEKAVSAYYASINWGKNVLFKDLRDSADLDEVQALCKDADIIIANFNRERCEAFSLGYEAIVQGNLNVIYASLTGFGPDDPRPAFDVVLQAEAGFLYMCGEPNGNPVKMPVALIDVIAAHHLKEGILLALLKRKATGKGSLVEVSLYQAAIASLVNQASNYLNVGFVPQKMGCQHPNIAPYGDYFTTADNKQIVLAVGSDAQFLHLTMVLGIKDSEISNFKKNQDRVEKRDALIELLHDKIKDWKSDALATQLQQKKIPFGIIKDMKEVFENPMARSMILEEQHADGSISKRVSSMAFSIK
ncbi:MAG: CoA transferase [Saprospiraceae bacterium]|nr:CoA transferase [Saprospiraceae bacterium]